MGKVHMIHCHSKKQFTGLTGVKDMPKILGMLSGRGHSKSFFTFSFIPVELAACSKSPYFEARGPSVATRVLCQSHWASSSGKAQNTVSRVKLT